MDLTRVNHPKLAASVEKAESKLDEALSLLESHLVQLSDEQRSGLVRPPKGFPKAGRALARAMVDHKNVAALTSFDSAAVTEDLDNVEALDGLEQKIGRIGQLIADSRLLWLAEAYAPSLGAYAVAKVASKNEPALSEVIKPLAAVFGSRRAPAKPNR